jgi:hypothetical protein
MRRRPVFADFRKRPIGKLRRLFYRFLELLMPLISAYTVHLSIVRFEVANAEKVETQGIIDGIRTLKPASKILVEIPHPGEGPDHFLGWALAELTEAEGTSVVSDAARKAFNVSILSKCAVECLVDWYLSKHLLHLTIPLYAGLAQKLQALNAEARLGMGLSLFQSIIFDPRNNAVHRYKLVDLAEARRSYELANFTILHCRNTEPPHLSPIFYGRLEIYRGEDAVQQAGKGTRIMDNATAFYFAGIGDRGECAVFIDRNNRESRICILTSLGNGHTDVRYCPIANNFSSEQLREVIHLLEASHPTPIELSRYELESVLQAMSGRDNRQGMVKL